MSEQPKVDSYDAFRLDRERGAQKAAEHGNKALADRIRETSSRDHYNAAKSGDTGWWKK